MSLSEVFCRRCKHSNEDYTAETCRNCVAVKDGRENPSMFEPKDFCCDCKWYDPEARHCNYGDIETPPTASCMNYHPRPDPLANPTKALELTENEQGGRQHKREYRSQAVMPKALLEVSKVRYEAVEINKYEDNNYKKIPQDENIGRALTHLWSALSDGYATGLSKKDDLSHAACRILFALEQEIENGGEN